MGVPSGSDTSFDVLIRFVTEMVQGKGAKETLDTLDSLQSKVTASNKQLQSSVDLLKKWKKQLDDMKQSLKAIPVGTMEYQALSRQINLATEGIRYQTKVVNESKEANKKLTQELKNAEAAEKSRLTNAIKASTIMTRVSSDISRISSGLVVGGTALSGGIFKLAKDFIDSAKEETQVTREWKQATDSIAQSYSRVGAVAAREVLPFLKEARDIAAAIASFAEAHPDIVGGALKIGLIALAIGTIGKAVAGGIKLVADATYITATLLQEDAANKNLLAAAGMDLAATGFAATIGAVLIPALVIFAGVLSGVLVGLMAYEAIAKNSGGKVPDLETLGTQAVNVIKAKSQEIWDKIKEGANMAGDAVGKFGDNTDKLVAAFQKMNDDLLAEQQKYDDDREKIQANTNKALIDQARSNSNAVISIRAKAEKRNSDIRTSYDADRLESTKKYESDRANIVRDGGVEIARIEKDRLDKLRQLEQDHSDKMDDLIANRDALGIVLENRNFDRQKAELDRSTNEEIAQRRQDLAIRLQDLAANFQAERAQKFAKFQQDLKDNQIQEQLELKEQARQNAERIRSIRENANQELRELDLQHREEQKRIREAFLSQVRDLDASLLGEQNKKRAAYSAMLSDLDRFLAEERRKRAGGISASGSVRGFRTGGYAYNEMIQTHGTEFIASQSTTRALERLVGGRLSQQGLVAAVAGSVGGGSLVLNDHRRFSGEYTKSMKRAVHQDTLSTISEALPKKR